MQTLQIQLPDSINLETQEIQLLLASRLYEKGLLSSRTDRANDWAF